MVRGRLEWLEFYCTFVSRTPCNLKFVVSLATVGAKSMKWFVRREQEVPVGRGLRIASFPLLVYVLGSLAFDWG